MRRNELVALLVALALIAVPRASAADTCYCMAETKHPDMPFECAGGIDNVTWAEACVCHDSCDGSGGSLAGSPAGKAAFNAAGAVALVLILVIIPGRPLGWMGGDAGEPGLFRAKWRAVKEQIAAYERRGREARALLGQLRAAEASGLAEEEQLRDATRPSWHKTLEPRASGSCSLAHAQLRRGGVEFPLEGFAHWEGYCGRCPCEPSVPPVPLAQCTADHFSCVNAALCCPRSHPNYNTCDGQCYRTQDYDGSRSYQVAACETVESCKLPAP